jgi:DNA-binding IclR family transcriptional regulator
MSTVEKVAAVLSAVTEAGGSAELSELLAKTELSKPTLYRVLRSLVDAGLVVHGVSGGYRLGPQAFAMAAVALGSLAVPPTAREQMLTIAATTGTAVHLSLLRAGQLVYADKVDGDTAFRLQSEIGRIQSFHSSAIGKSILAAFDDDGAAQILGGDPLPRFTPHTMTTASELLAALPEIRRRGFASDDEEDEPSTRAVGVSILSSTGNPIGGLSVVAPSFERSLNELEAHVPLLRSAAAALLP